MSNLPPEPDSVVSEPPEEDVEAHLLPGDGRRGDRVTEPAAGHDAGY